MGIQQIPATSVGYRQSQADPGVTVTTGAGAGSAGSWVEIFSATNFATRYIIISVGGGAAAIAYRIQIGIGGSGSESVILTASFVINATGSAVVLPFPFEIAEGVRVAARTINDTDANARAVLTGITVLGE